MPPSSRGGLVAAIMGPKSAASFRPREKYLIFLVLATFGFVCFGAIFFLPTEKPNGKCFICVKKVPKKRSITYSSCEQLIILTLGCNNRQISQISSKNSKISSKNGQSSSKNSQLQSKKVKVQLKQFVFQPKKAKIVKFQFKLVEFQGKLGMFQAKIVAFQAMIIKCQAKSVQCQANSSNFNQNNSNFKEKQSYFMQNKSNFKQKAKFLVTVAFKSSSKIIHYDMA